MSDTIPEIPEAEFVGTLSLLDLSGLARFSTLDFAEQLEAYFPKTWRHIVSKYGAGGKNAGRHYSAYSFVSQHLHHQSLAGTIEKFDYESAPSAWGAPVIRFWGTISGRGESVFLDQTSNLHEEGGKVTILVNRYERDLDARRECIEHYGAACAACKFDFEVVYGDRGKDFIHVHHHQRISTRGGRYRVDPIQDLVPVCPKLSFDDSSRSERSFVGGVATGHRATESKKAKRK